MTDVPHGGGQKGREMHKLIQIYRIKRVKKLVWYMGHTMWVVRIFFFPGLNRKKKIGVTLCPAVKKTTTHRPVKELEALIVIFRDG